MLRFAANLSTLWPELSPYERFDRAAQAGFRHVEYLFPHLLDQALLDHAIRKSGVQLILFDLHPGDMSRGELGLLCHPGREPEFERSVEAGLALAERFGVRLVNCLVGIQPEGVSRERAQETAARNLVSVAKAFESADVTLLIEAINPGDRPGYLAGSVRAAAQLVYSARSPAVRLLFDLYHATLTGDPLADIERYVALVAHVQVADAPGRHQPGTGSAPVREFLARLGQLRYDGYVGLEYVPEGSTEASLEWLPRAERSGLDSSSRSQTAP